MLQAESVQQHVDTLTLDTLLQLLTGTESVVLQGLEGVWHQLRPAAEGLSSEAVLQLLQTAAVHGQYVYAGLLLQLPVAQQFSSDAKMQLLENAVDKGTGDSRSRAEHASDLFRMAAADQPPGRVVQLLHVLLQCGSVDSLGTTGWLRAAKQFSSQEVLQLLHACICSVNTGGQQSSKPTMQEAMASDCVSRLVCVQAAFQLSYDFKRQRCRQLLSTAITAAWSSF
jgi:hypothetical protein